MAGKGRVDFLSKYHFWKKSAPNIPERQNWSSDMTLEGLLRYESLTLGYLSLEARLPPQLVFTIRTMYLMISKTHLTVASEGTEDPEDTDNVTFRYCE